MKIIICTPSKRGGDFDHFKCLNDFENYCKSKGHNVKSMKLIGPTLLDHARSAIATKALEEDCDVLLWADDDIIFKKEDALSLCENAFNLNAVVGAVAVARQKLGNLFVKFEEKLNEYPFFKNGRLIKAQYIGLCLTAAPKSVFTEMSKSICTLKNSPLGKVYPFFCPIVTKTDYLGEDYSFCYRVSKAGFNIYADTRIRVKHKGDYYYGVEDSMFSITDVEDVKVKIK